MKFYLYFSPDHLRIHGNDQLSISRHFRQCHMLFGSDHLLLFDIVNANCSHLWNNDGQALYCF